jgi:ribosome-associated translation inhibitor RaiA
MNTTFSSKNYTLTPSEHIILNKKVKFIQKVLKKSKGNPILKIEIEELAKIDDLGNKYRCEANLTIYDKSIYVSKLASKLRSAMDECFIDLKIQIIKGTKKFKSTIIKNAVKNKYSFLNRLLGRKTKQQDVYENIE